MKNKCLYRAQKVCCVLFSELWLTLPNQEPSFLTLARSYLHRCYSPAFLSACLFIECVHRPGRNGPPLREITSRSFHWDREQRRWCLYKERQSRAHMGSPPMRNHYGVKAVASLCKCNLAVLRLAPACCCAIAECLLWGWSRVRWVFGISHFPTLAFCLSVRGLRAFGAYLFMTLAVSLVS